MSTPDVYLYNFNTIKVAILLFIFTEVLNAATGGTDPVSFEQVVRSADAVVFDLYVYENRNGIDEVINKLWKCLSEDKALRMGGR